MRACIDGRTIFNLPEHPLVEDGVVDDTINHPAHYTAGKYETIDVIRDICESQDLKPMEAVYAANIIKYISRFKHKNGVEDLKKAAWYLERLIGEQGNDSAR